MNTLTMLRTLLPILCLAVASAVEAGQLPTDSPRVDLIVGDKAPPLEVKASQELAEQLRTLFNADVRISAKLPADTDNVIVLGSPATNPAVNAVLGTAWPKLSDQGQLLRSVSHKGRNVLVVGGGSAVATLWAAYELGHHFGMRYLLTGDAPPANRPKLALDKIDILLEPTLKQRTWRTINDFAIGPEAWGLEEHQLVLAQLAKLKFNRIMIAVYPWQPFVDYEFGGVKKSTGVLWYGHRYPVDGDTPGRVAFKGAKEFENPDLAGKKTYAERTAAGIRLIRGVMDAAKKLGMSVALAISPLEFPKEFAAALPNAKVLTTLDSLTIGPGPGQPPDDPLLMKLVKCQIQAYLSTYPQTDALYLTMPEFPGWVEHHEQAWKRLDAEGVLTKSTSLKNLLESARVRPLIASGERGVRSLQGNLAALDFYNQLLSDKVLFKRTDGSKLETNVIDVDPALYPILDKLLPQGTGALNFLDYTARRVADNRELLKLVPAKSVKSSLILTLADDNVGVLPQLSTAHLDTLVRQIRADGWEGFSTRYWISGDLDPCVYYLSRSSFDPKLTPLAAYRNLVDAMCGEGVSDSLVKAFDMIEKATAIIDSNDIGFAFPVPGMIMKHYQSSEPPPAWWKEVNGLYASAMDEMYRGNTRARQGSRPFILHFAKRLEFAVEYMTCVEEVRLAAQAKAKQDSDGHLEHLEKGVEALYNALTAIGVVSRDSGDRGVIAVVNEYGYRPLKKEFDAAQEK